MIFTNRFITVRSFTQKILFALTAALMLPLSGWSSEPPAPQPVIVQEQNVHRAEVAEENLPPRIQKDLINNYYKVGGMFVEAFKYLDEEGNIVKYEVRVEMKGKDVEIIYDTKGTPIKKQERKQKNNNK